MLIYNVSLSVAHINFTWGWICYYLAGIGGSISGLMYAWAHEVCSDDNEERAIVVATMNDMGYVLQAWLPLIVWQQIDAPQYTKCFITSSCVCVLLVATILTIKVLQREIAK
jgi:ACS family pantothenate transporter-like MFS transporter